jgi:NAD(P)-dependent dehydrogenase (short-subunit alcohol dehydrogenase family)
MANPTIVLVTGASSGIGRAAARMLADKGCRVFGTVRNLNNLKALSGVEFVQMDVCDDASVHQGVQAVWDRAGRIDVLVNSAGVALGGAVEETSISEAKSLFDTDFFGVLRTIKEVLPHMRAQRYGRIVNVSGAMVFLPAPYLAVYAASKSAVEALSESLDHEVRQFGVRVTLVAPSFTHTDIFANSMRATVNIPAYQAERSSVNEMFKRRMSTAPDPRHVAGTIVEAATGPWRMRRYPPGEASLLPKLRRFAPATLLDARLRKELGLHRS